jgi:hypothetical protein
MARKKIPFRNWREPYLGTFQYKEQTVYYCKFSCDN